VLAQDGWQDGPAQFMVVDAPASYLGVNIRDVDEHSAKLLGLKSTQGVEVIAVDHDAPAGKMGIHLRDVIITVDGKAVTSANQFRATMRALPPGREVNLGVLRDGKPLRFFVKLADRAKLQHQALLQHFSVPMPEVGNSFSNAVAMQQDMGDDDDADVIVARPYRIGAILNPIGPQLAAFFGVKDGTGLLVMSVEDGGPAAAAGLHAGDVVLKLNEVTIVSPLDWMRTMQAAQDKPIQLTIVREKRIQVLTIVAPKTQARLEDLPFAPELTLALEQLRRQMQAVPFSAL
jgi:S1-C subfamily serine protease